MEMCTQAHSRAIGLLGLPKLSLEMAINMMEKLSERSSRGKAFSVKLITKRTKVLLMMASFMEMGSLRFQGALTVFLGVGIRGLLR